MCSSGSRYDRMSTVSSTERACREPLSSGATTATAPSPRPRAARNTRNAISPRLATSTLCTRETLAVDQQAVDRAEEPPGAPRDVGQEREMVGDLRGLLPQLVHDRVRRPVDVLSAQVLAPQAEP